MRSPLYSLAALAAFVIFSDAQNVPAFQGELLLQPGLSNSKCLTASANADGAQVAIQPCTGAPNQKWTFTGGSIRIFGNKCLDVPEGQTANGIKLQIWTCWADNNNQKWNYNRDNRIRWVNRGKCLDLTKGDTTDGNRVQTWECRDGNINNAWNVGYMYNQLPQTSQIDQFGINNCGTTSSQDSKCQTSWINSAQDFCLFAPAFHGTVGDEERRAVSYCTKSGRGTRTMPDGTLTGVHFVKTPEYVQITGTGDFTKINIPQGDYGGELDNRGADGRGNPIGGLLYGNSFGNGLQYHEWTEFISDREFCIRACIGARATQLCNHIYDIMGCWWNIPANYQSNVYEECQGNPAIPMGVYGTSTWYQGVSPTPPPHPAPASSQCQSFPTVGTTPLRRRSGLALGDDRMLVKRAATAAAFPGATPAPL